MKVKIEPARILQNFLRKNLTDPNPSRTGKYVSANFSRAKNMGDNNFPKINVTLITENSERMGIFDDNNSESVTFQIDVRSKKDQGFTFTVVDEALGTMAAGSNSDRFTLEFIPKAITNVKHDGTAYGTVDLVSSDDDFTTPAALSADTVEISLGTGNVNFSAADVASHTGEAITTSYTYFAEGRKLSQKIARDIVKNIRTGWRTDESMKGLFNPVKISNQPMPFEEPLGLFRQMLQYSFTGFNFGEDVG